MGLPSCSSAIPCYPVCLEPVKVGPAALPLHDHDHLGVDSAGADPCLGDFVDLHKISFVSIMDSGLTGVSKLRLLFAKPPSATPSLPPTKPLHV